MKAEGLILALNFCKYVPMNGVGMILCSVLEIMMHTVQREKKIKKKRKKHSDTFLPDSGS